MSESYAWSTGERNSRIESRLPESRRERKVSCAIICATENEASRRSTSSSARPACGIADARGVVAYDQHGRVADVLHRPQETAGNEVADVHVRVRGVDPVLHSQRAAHSDRLEQHRFEFAPGNDLRRSRCRRSAVESLCRCPYQPPNEKTTLPEQGRCGEPPVTTDGAVAIPAVARSRDRRSRYGSAGMSYQRVWMVEEEYSSAKGSVLESPPRCDVNDDRGDWLTARALATQGHEGAARRRRMGAPGRAAGRRQAAQQSYQEITPPRTL